MVKILTSLLFIFLTINVYAEEFDHYSYWFYTGNTVKFAWDKSANAIEYEVEFYHVEHKVPMAFGRTAQMQIQFICPRSGHYFGKVRAIGETEKSEWAVSSSVDYATVNGVARSWWIYCRVEPPSGGVIE